MAAPALSPAPCRHRAEGLHREGQEVAPAARTSPLSLAPAPWEGWAGPQAQRRGPGGAATPGAPGPSARGGGGRLHFPASSAPPPGGTGLGKRRFPAGAAAAHGGVVWGLHLPAGSAPRGSRRESRGGAAVRAGTGSPRGRRPRLRAARASGGALTLRVCLVACLRCSRSACPSLAGKMAAVRRARSYSRCVVRFSDRELC